MMGGFENSVSSEHRSLLHSKNFGLRPLSTSGHLNLWKVFCLALEPTIVFCFGLSMLTLDFRFANPQVDLLIYGLGLVLLLIYPAVAFVLLLVGVIASLRKARWSAVAYWAWWPFWRLALCVAAAAFASAIGDHLWYTSFYPHIRLTRLQGYRQIDPMTVSGSRLQDAGLVTFNRSAGVDRARGGCLKNGATYCVAPVLRGGEVPTPDQEALQYGHSNTDTSHHQNYDIFMAGVDCCSCPGEFRCGDWNKPLETGGYLGGIRVMDADRRKFFRLAAEEWATTHGKAVTHPVFFEWVEEPVTALRDMKDRGNQLRILSYFVLPLAFLVSCLVLNGIFSALIASAWAAPLDTLLPPPGIGRMLSSKFLPHMYHHDADQRRQQESWLGADPKYVVL